MNKITRFFREIGISKKTLFIVDDNELYARTLKEFLEIRFPGAKTTLFPTGEACLAQLYQEPDVIIMDHLLNTKSANAATGLSVIKTIKARHAAAHIFLLSAQKDLSVFVEALSEYGCDYLKKDEQAFGKLAELMKSKVQMPSENDHQTGKHLSGKHILTSVNNQ
jgi:ActR/RegA family two-component response regulator